MNSIQSSPKRIEKVSSDNVVVGYDLLSNLTYMSVLSIGGLPRDRLLDNTGKQVLKTSIFFEYIHVLATRVGMEYSEAFRLVAERARATSVKSLLLRFAAALGSGESERDFIEQETKLEGQRYGNQYNRSVENLRKWTDAYAAILVSVSLIMVVSLVSTLLGSLDVTFVMLMALVLFSITSVGVFVIYKVSPVEQVTFDSEDGLPPFRKRSRFLAISIPPVGVVLTILIIPHLSLMTAAATGFTLMGLSLLPAGYYAWKDDGLVAKIDLEISTFLRSVGEIAGSAGVTLTEAIRRIDARALVNLQDYVDRLYSRLSASLPTPQCWDRFTAETGSELVKRSTAMLRDGAELGGRTDRVGEICSDYALQVSELRESRRLTSATFSYLSVPMHATVVFILVFVFQIVSVFSSKLSEVSSKMKEGAFSTDTVNTSATVPPGINLPAGGDMTGGLDMFATQDIGTLGGIIVFVIVVLTIANALAPKFAAGGSHLMITAYLSIMCLASGGLMFIIPLFTEALFDI